MIPNYLDLSYWKKPFQGELVNQDFIPSQHQPGESSQESGEISNHQNDSSILRAKSLIEKNPFIDDEAIDDDHEFDDSEDYDYDLSFTMLSTTQKLLARRDEEQFIARTPNIEVRAQDHFDYLKTTRDMVGVPEHQKYKLKYDYDPAVNVFSQAVCEMSEDDDYQMDSFCNDEIVYETDSEMDKSSPNLSTKRHDSNDSQTPIQPKKRRRIIIESP